MVDAVADRLRHGAQLDPAERHGRCGRLVLVLAGGRNGAASRLGADADGDLHADRRLELHDGDGEHVDQRHEGNTVDQLADPGRDRLRHDALDDPVERDDERARHLRVHAGRRNRPGRWLGSHALDDVHADRPGELHDRDRQRHHQCHEGDALDHLADAREHRLRHRARRGAVERDDERAGHVRIHAGRRCGSERRTGPDAVDHVHADRSDELHDGDRQRHDHGDEGDAGDHLADACEYRLRHGAERDAVERDDDGARRLRVHAGGRCGPRRRRGPEPVDDVHANGYGELRDGVGKRFDHGDEGDALDHVAGAGGYRLRHALERDATERDCDRRGLVCLHAGGRRLAERGHAHPVGDVHANRLELPDRDQERVADRLEGDADAHVAGAGGYRLRHAAWARRS